MPTNCYRRDKSKLREIKKRYWINKGYSKLKAETLLNHYGY